MNLTFAAQLNKMITAGLGGAVAAPETGVAVGRRVEYTSIGPAPILTFEANLELPFKALSINMEPIQSGSGDPSPSNVRPISGRSEVGVWRSGKNLLSPGKNRTTNGITFTVNSDGTVTASGTASATAFWGTQFTIPTGSYTHNGCPSGISGITCDIRNAVGGSGISGIDADGGSGATFTISEELTAYYNIRVQSGTTLNNAVIKPMIRPASVSDATYEPYTADTITVQLGQTVYGGTVDAVSGVMTVDRAMVTYDGSLDENWTTRTTGSGYTLFEHGLSNAQIPQSATQIGKCNMFPWNIELAANMSYRLLNTAISVRYDGLTLAEWKAYLAQNPLEVCYPLATPVTVQLTAQQLTTLLGTNNVWSDGGDVSLTYGNIYYTEGY